MHTTYHVEETGSGEALLLLHGFTGSCRSWDEFVPILARQYRVICVDLPGHGFTPAPADLKHAELVAVAADLAVLLEQRSASPAHILGYSMGARLALGLALTQPAAVRTLMLESGSPGLATESERVARQKSDEVLAQRIEQYGITAFVEEWERLPLWESQQSLPEEVRQRQRVQRLANTPHGLAASLRSMGTGTQSSFWDLLPTLPPATLLITGAMDTKFCQIAAEMCARNTRFKHHTIAAAGHTPHLEQPDVLHEIVQASLKGSEKHQ